MIFTKCIHYFIYNNLLKYIFTTNMYYDCLNMYEHETADNILHTAENCIHLQNIFFIFLIKSWNIFCWIRDISLVTCPWNFWYWISTHNSFEKGQFAWRLNRV